MTGDDSKPEQLSPVATESHIASPNHPADHAGGANESHAHGKVSYARGLRRLFAVFIAVAAVAGIVVLCLSLPVSRAPFRLHATTSFLGLKAASDFHISIAAEEWDASMSESTGQSLPKEKYLAVRRLPQANSKDPAPDRLNVWIRAGDEVIVQRLPGPPTRYAITLPSEPADLAIQLAGSTHIGRTDETGKEAIDPKPESILRLKIGGSNQPALRVLPTEGRGDFGERVSVSLLGFGHPNNQAVEAGLLGGAMQFLDKPESELQLYRGTDLRLGNVDGEVSAAVLTSDAIEVSANGVADNVSINVSTHRGRNESRNIMPSRYEWLKGQPIIAVALGFLATVVGTAGLLLSAAGASPSFNRWLHRLVRSEK
jgi:hypothetical protein